MGMDSAKLSNSNNRKLQNRVRSFDERILSAETRKIRDFPMFHPKEATAFRVKIQKEAKRQKRLNIIMFTVLAAIALWLLFLLN